MGCKTDPKSPDITKNDMDEQTVTSETQQVSDSSHADITHFSTPPSHTGRLPQPERPQSAHIHRVCGQLLRLIGDDYLCNSCGRALQIIGDQLTTEYAMRRTLSCNDLEKLNVKR